MVLYIFVASLLLASFVCASELNLLLVQVIHRHGARSPLPPANASIICPRGCGLLNLQGKDMLLKQGAYLRARYNGSRPDVYNGTPFFGTELYPDGTTYDVRNAYSRSTDLTRTLQSASGLLKGLFPNSTEYYPAINTVQFLQDELLLIDVSPSYHIYQQLNTDVFAERLKLYIHDLFPDPSILHAISVENSLQEYCEHEDNFVTCVLGLQDIAAARNAEGTLPSLPITHQYLNELNLCRTRWNSYYFPFNASDPVSAARGSLGQNVVQQMIQNMQSAMVAATTNQSALFPYKLMHYSAHDTTVMPFCATLGNDDFMLPPFGQMYLLELLQSTADGSFHVRAAQSVPGQTPESLHFVNESAFPLHCMNDTNATYVVGAGLTCPFSDFQRFVNRTLPLSLAGTCYVSPEALRAIDCDKVGGTGPLPNSTCYFYRSYCPTFACPPNSVLSPTSYACVPMDTTSIGGSVSSGIVAAAAVGSAFAGLFGGVVAHTFWARRARSAKYKTIVE